MKKSNKRLNLNKKTISNLDISQLDKYVGGGTRGCRGANLSIYPCGGGGGNGGGGSYYATLCSCTCHGHTCHGNNC